MTTNNAAAAPEQEAFLSGKKAKPSKWKSFCNFIKHKDPEKGTLYLGRTCKSWAQITGFYIVFYACLSGFFAICLAVFMSTINDERPKYIGQGTIIGQRPGLGFQPWLLGEPDSTLIKFNPKSPKTYKKYITRMRNFLKPYYDDKVKTDEKDEKCDGAKKDRKQACSYKKSVSNALTELGGNGTVASAKDLDTFEFGYNVGKPIVMLTLNRLMEYIPEAYEDEGELNETVTDISDLDVKRHSRQHILVVCDGQFPADMDNLGAVRYRPEQGFPIRFFPYRKYAARDLGWGYHQPVVFVQFSDIRKGVVVMVECRALGKNVAVDRYHKLGISHFELVVDDLEALRKDKACAGSKGVKANCTAA